jgi:hypothetical protein
MGSPRPEEFAIGPRRSTSVRGARRSHVAIVIALAMLTAPFLVSTGPAAVGAQPVFQDGFETGLVPQWSASSSMSVTSATVHAGTKAATTTSSVAWAERRLSTSLTDIDFSFWFSVTQRSDAIWLGRMRTPAGSSIMRVFLNASGALAYRNEVTDVNRVSTLKVPTGSGWHLLDVHAVIGSSGSVRVALDGASVSGLDRSENLGTTPVGRVEIGNRPAGHTYQLVFDDVTVVDGGVVAPPLAPPTALRTSALAPDRVSLAWDAPTTGPPPATYVIYRDHLQIGSVSGAVTFFDDTGVNDREGYAYQVASLDAAGVASAPTGALAVRMPGFDPGSDAVVLAAGDISCSSATVITPTTCHQGATSDILLQEPVDAVLALGDTQYEAGSATQFAGGYGPSWGRVKAITHPAVGNHEYKTGGAGGYFGYFGRPSGTGDPARGLSSFDLAGWHLIALNSNCTEATVGGCGVGSAQYNWLASDLAANPASCTIAYWHHPRWSSGASHGPNPSLEPIWDLLDASGVDLVLQGHEHLYERFAPIGVTPSGAPNPVLDSTGIRSFVVGTGGRSAYSFISPPLVGSEKRSTGTFGVLKLGLHASGYTWRFIPEWGKTFTDSGIGVCH